MTVEELVRKLKTECHTGDEEVDHSNADNLLLEFINDSRVDQAFQDIQKWYA